MSYAYPEGRAFGNNADLTTRNTYTMKTDDRRLMLAGHALSGLLASQPENKGWNIDALSVVSLKIADTVIDMASLEKLPELKAPDESQMELNLEPNNDEELQS